MLCVYVSVCVYVCVKENNKEQKIIKLGGSGEDITEIGRCKIQVINDANTVLMYEILKIYQQNNFENVKKNDALT